jgi:predicted DNA-binding ribbon-helix-helix protein
MMCYASESMSKAAEVHTPDVTEVRSRRRRAPRRDGRRTQLTVPAEMWTELTRVAHAMRTTPNDALVRLAAERLDDQRRAAALKQLADERWRAFTDADSTAPATDGIDPLTEDQLVELSLAFREDA